MPHTEAQLQLEGKSVSIGEVGQLFIKGYLVMPGYWKNPKATDQVLQNGWIDTGDLAIFEKDGSCRIVGRAKDMVIRGGENLYPFEIETHFLRHPKIHDIAIVGVPDPYFGEELCAFVIPKDPSSAETLEAQIRADFSLLLASHKIPRYFIICPQLPTTLTGKVKKHKLREIARHQLHL